MNQTILCLLVQGRPAPRVLLGLKLRGFGEGKCTREDNETLHKVTIEAWNGAS
jgi:hypothetical protein